MPELTERSLTEREFVTVSITAGGISITVTQDYSPYFDTGHYMHVIFDDDGNVIQANQTLGGAPKGKMDVAHVAGMLEEFLRERARFA